MSGTFLPRLTREELEELKSRLTDADRPVLVGYGPPEFATTLMMEPFPSIVWDVNGYYRDLGVSTNATRSVIKARYQELNGESSVRLTLIASVLLAKDERLRYDTTPLGETYLDAEIEDALRKKIADATKDIPSAEKPNDFAPTIAEVIEQQREEREIQLTQNQPRRERWSYYQWGTTCADTEKLSRWRAEISSAYSKESLAPPRTMGVGFMSGNELVKVEKIGYRIVVFLHEDAEPSDVLASVAVLMGQQNHSRSI